MINYQLIEEAIRKGKNVTEVIEKNINLLESCGIEDLEKTRDDNIKQLSEEILRLEFIKSALQETKATLFNVSQAAALPTISKTEEECDRNIERFRQVILESEKAIAEYKKDRFHWCLIQVKYLEDIVMEEAYDTRDRLRAELKYPLPAEDTDEAITKKRGDLEAAETALITAQQKVEIAKLNMSQAKEDGKENEVGDLTKLEAVLFGLSSNDPLLGVELAEAKEIVDYCKKYQEYNELHKLISKVGVLLDQSSQKDGDVFTELQEDLGILLDDSQKMLGILKKTQNNDLGWNKQRRTFEEHMLSFARLTERYEFTKKRMGEAEDKSFSP